MFHKSLEYLLAYLSNLLVPCVIYIFTLHLILHFYIFFFFSECVNQFRATQKLIPSYVLIRIWKIFFWKTTCENVYSKLSKNKIQIKTLIVIPSVARLTFRILLRLFPAEVFTQYKNEYKNESIAIRWELQVQSSVRCFTRLHCKFNEPEIRFETSWI